MAKPKIRAVLSSLLLCLSALPVSAQADNLLQNPKADLDARHWRAYGRAAVEDDGGNRVFVVRNGGHFYQDVTLPEDASGQFALLIGRGSSERINVDGAITDLPYLYGYLLAPGEPAGGNIVDYLQGQEMLCSPRHPGEWVKMWGIFRVTEGTRTIRFFLNQALGRGVPHNGSAARFDDLGLYLFRTEEEAKTFADGYN